MCRRSLLALLVVLGGLAIASPPVPAAAAGCPTAFSAGFVAALARDYPGVRFTAAVYDTASGCWHHIHPGLQITTASVIKAQVMGAVLLKAQDSHRSLTSAERSLISPMIRYSSNPETSQLYEQIGGAAGLHATDSRLGATATNHVRPFGLTSSTAVDRSRVALSLLHGGGDLTQAGREEAWAFMSNVHPLQQWGITAGVPHGWSVALKNGFYPSAGIGWRVGSSGFVRRDDGDQGYAISVMTEGMSQQVIGIGLVERIARQAAATLTVGPAALRTVDRARCVTASSGESWAGLALRVGLPASRAAEVRLTAGGNDPPLSGQRACSTVIPAEPTSAGSAVNGRYRAVATDLNCDGEDDLLWYAPGEAPDYLWRGHADRRFRSTPVVIGGDLVPVAGDFNGDGCGDVLWYGAGIRPDLVWWGGAVMSTSVVSVRGLGYVPRAGDFDGDGRTDVLWYAPGGAPDFLWFGTPARTFTSKGTTVTAAYEPVVGDVDANGAEDLVWYAPGTNSDWVWLGQVGTRAFSIDPLSANGRYRPIALDQDGAGGDALLWYAPGAAPDSLWNAVPPTSTRPLAIGGDYLPIAGDFDGDGRDDIAWFGPGGLPDNAWWGKADGGFSSTALTRAS